MSKAAPALQVEQTLRKHPQRWHVIARSVECALINITTAQAELPTDNPLHPTLGFHIKMLELLNTYVIEQRAERRRQSMVSDGRKPGSPMSIQNDRLRRMI